MKPQHQWQCISGCGACCRLDPALRGEALEALDPQQQQTYLAMVGADGWCIHFDTGRRRCRIYGQRPDFCRVENLVGLFSANGCGDAETPVAAGENWPRAADNGPGHGLGHGGQLDDLAIACCRQQIRSEWGGHGKVMKRFNRAIRHAIRHPR